MAAKTASVLRTSGVSPQAASIVAVNQPAGQEQSTTSTAPVRVFAPATRETRTGQFARHSWVVVAEVGSPETAFGAGMTWLAPGLSGRVAVPGSWDRDTFQSPKLVFTPAIGPLDPGQLDLFGQDWVLRDPSVGDSRFADAYSAVDPLRLWRGEDPLMKPGDKRPGVRALKKLGTNLGSPRPAVSDTDSEE